MVAMSAAMCYNDTAMPMIIDTTWHQAAVS